MGARKQNNDYRFYKGFDGEPELILQSGDYSLHIWEGYIDDILGEPILSDGRMSGMTLAYHEYIGPFSDDGVESAIDGADYVEDCRRYRGRRFAFKESNLVLEAMINWFEEHYKSEITTRIS